MRIAFATVPKRQLLTYHDAYAYFAQTYDWKVIGAIQISDFEDPRPSEVADLIDQVRASGVPAIFGSEVFPSPVLEQIGREAGVQYVDELRDDDLPGEPGDAEHSWLGLMRLNFVTMTEALGGDATALGSINVADVAPDTRFLSAMSDEGCELVRLDGVTCGYGPRAVLDDICLSIGDEQFSAIVGPSGSGKTTLLKVLLGNVSARRGAVVRRAEPSHRLRPPGRNRRLELSRHGARMRPDGAHADPRASTDAALAEPQRAGVDPRRAGEAGDR